MNNCINKSLVIIGAFNDINKPGGDMLRPLSLKVLNGNLSLVNPKEYKIQEIKSYAWTVDILEHADP